MLLKNSIALILLFSNFQFLYSIFNCTINEQVKQRIPDSLCIELKVIHEQEDFNKNIWDTLAKKVEFLVEFSNEPIKPEFTEAEIWPSYLAKFGAEMQNIYLATKNESSLITSFSISVADNEEALKQKEGIYLKLYFKSQQLETALTQWAQSIEQIRKLIESYEKDNNPAVLFNSLDKVLPQLFGPAGEARSTIHNFETQRIS